MFPFRALLNNVFTVERRTRTPDGQGGFEIDRVTVGFVRGRIRPANTREREVAASEERELSHVLYVVAGANIGRGDYVTTRGITFEVMGVREPSLMDHHWEIDCMERQQEVNV